MAAELSHADGHTDGQTDGHDESNSRFLKFFEHSKLNLTLNSLSLHCKYR